MEETGSFSNRHEAGLALAMQLERFRGDRDAVVVGLARGGVILAGEIARHLGLPLQVLIVRKLGAPGNPEYALGALTETGFVHVDREAPLSARISRTGLDAFIKREIEQEELEIRRRIQLYRNGEALPRFVGKTVILVDDGVATGETFVAAAKTIREQLGAERTIGAVPVCSRDRFEQVRDSVDELVALIVPQYLSAVGEFYDDFSQVTDDQVIATLRNSKASLSHRAGPNR